MGTNVVDSGYSARLTKIIDDSGLTKNAFARSIDVDSANFSRYAKRGRLPRTMAAKISRKYGVNLGWLLSGEGEMYSTGGSNIIGKNRNVFQNVRIDNNETIEALKDNIATLKKQLDDKDKIIALLEEQLRQS